MIDIDHGNSPDAHVASPPFDTIETPGHCAWGFLVVCPGRASRTAMAEPAAASLTDAWVVFSAQVLRTRMYRIVRQV